MARTSRGDDRLNLNSSLAASTSTGRNSTNSNTNSGGASRADNSVTTDPEISGIDPAIMQQEVHSERPARGTRRIKNEHQHQLEALAQASADAGPYYSNPFGLSTNSSSNKNDVSKSDLTALQFAVNAAAIEEHSKPNGSGGFDNNHNGNDPIDNNQNHGGHNPNNNNSNNVFQAFHNMEAGDLGPAQVDPDNTQARFSNQQQTAQNDNVEFLGQLQNRYQRSASQLNGPSGGEPLGRNSINSLLTPVADRIPGGPGSASKRRIRLRWTEEETNQLVEGCKRHGVGNWKKILTDPNFQFHNRTAVDLKDRFRTSFPEEYSRLYPNAKTHKTKRQSMSIESNLVKINRKERRSFTPDEDERLLQGYLKHGPAWSKIQRDASLNLFERRSTDLRDRFRNAFPDRYTAAGYKGRGSSSVGIAKDTNSVNSVSSGSSGNTSLLSSAANANVSNTSPSHIVDASGFIQGNLDGTDDLTNGSSANDQVLASYSSGQPLPSMTQQRVHDGSNSRSYQQMQYGNTQPLFFNQPLYRPHVSSQQPPHNSQN